MQQSIDLSFNYDNQSESSLIQLWKLTNNPFISTNTKSSTQRINNRSWRLLNKQVLLRRASSSSASASASMTSTGPRPSTSTTNQPLRINLNLSKSSLTDILPPSDHKLPNNSTSKPSLLSHSSKLSLLSSSSTTRKSTNTSNVSPDKRINLAYNQKHPDHDLIHHDGEDDVDDIPSSDLDDEDDHDDDNTNEDEQHKLNEHLHPPNKVNHRQHSASSLFYTDNQSQPQSQSQSSPLPQPLSKNIFYIANSPSPPQKNDHHNHELSLKQQLLSKQQQQSHSHSQSVHSISPLHQQHPPRTSSSSSSTHNNHHQSQTTIGNTTSTPAAALPPPITRQSSLFSNNYQIQPKSNANYDSDGYSSSDIDEDEDDILEEDEEEEDETEHNVQPQQHHQHHQQHQQQQQASIQKSNSRFFDKRSTSHTGLKSNLKSSEKIIIKDKSRSTSTDENDSEWLSVSSEDDPSNKSLENEKLLPLQFNKVIPTSSHISNLSSTSTDILPIMEDGETNINNIPSQLNSRTNSTSHLNLNSSRYGSMKQPRSLLSGLFLNELANNSNLQVDAHSNKPILKRSSTTGILSMKNLPFNGMAPQNNSTSTATTIATTTNKLKSNKRPPFVSSRRHTSMTDIPHDYGSQQTKVLQFNNDHILTTIENNHSHDQIENIYGNGTTTLTTTKQKSIVGVSYNNVTSTDLNTTNFPTNRNLNSIEKDNATGENHETLSSSLQRISRSVSNNSIRNYFTKSSLNLTKIYSSKFGKSETSFTSEKSNQPQLSTHLESTPSASGHIDTPPPSSSSTSQQQQQQDQPVSVQILPPTPILKSSHSSQHQDSNKHSSSDHLNPIEMSPNTKRKETLSSELSESLKESIIIDHKLGKIPLPSKVIDSEKLLRANGMAMVGGDDSSDFDDYHSKGW